MNSSRGSEGAVHHAQNVWFGSDRDYVEGSPHLRHANLRKRIDDRISDVISQVVRRKGECAVLEIGAGHGFFTDTVLGAGGSATVTEMSEPSYRYLAQRYRDVPNVRVVHDVDGKAPYRDTSRYDVILFISVIHHIPDYIDVVTNLCDRVLSPGGAVITFQDPVWYPRQSRWERALSQAPYFAWRLGQGEFRKGLATRWRRLRGVYSDTEPSDLAEYHVVRQGVDDLALAELLRQRFDNVDLDRYFSTQSPRLQALFENRFPPNTFGIVASGYHPKGS